MNAYIVIGNGISIDYINHVDMSNKINLSNLFDNGEKVRWPVDNSIGFLSYKRCPALWILGARPTSSGDLAKKIVSDIITCANVYASLDVKKRPKLGNGIDSIYLKAYNELVSYLRFLFVYYDEITKKVEKNTMANWEWAKVFEKLYNDDSIKKIIVITYNYDIWLERILLKLNLNYSVYLGDGHDARILIYKPHGSISFIHENEMELSSFELKNTFEHTDAELSNFSIRYSDLVCNPSVIPLIPPAGQASKYKNSWAAKIRQAIKAECSNSNEDDVLIFGGISYWHVDREEIDEIILEIDKDINIYLVNPNPPEEFFAVLTTIFKNAVHLPTSRDVLGEVL